jgi:hypothetical protein
MGLVQQENNMKIKIAKVDSLDDLIQNFNSLFKEVGEEISSDKECKEECTEECPSECKEDIVETETDPEGMELTDDVYMVNENYFLLANKVNGINITDNTDLVFGHVNGERYVPGITEEQILTVLLYKNRNDKRRYDLIKQLLFN